MRLYRKVVPKIARDVVATLNTKQLIEVEDGRLGEAELDLAAVMVEHLNAEDRIIKEAKDTLTRRGLGMDRFLQVLRSVAEIRGVKIGDEGLEFIENQLIEALFASKNIAEVFGEDNEIRLVVKEVMQKYLAISEDIDKEARQRLKNLREGTPEWEIEYPRMVAQLKKHKSMA